MEALIQCCWRPYKKRLGRIHTEERPYEDKEKMAVHMPRREPPGEVRPVSTFSAL